MVKYFINMTAAALVAGISYKTYWWLPAIIFPAWIFVSRVTPLEPGKISQKKIIAIRSYFYLLAAVYMMAQIVIFQIHLGSWYGWIVGLILGWAVGGMVAGKLEPILMHRELP